MKKIPTLFIRNSSNRKLVTSEINPECSWVSLGEGKATRKYDGMCCKIENGQLLKRREIKPGKSIPEYFIEEHFDEITKKRVGWVPTDLFSKEDKYFAEAILNGGYPTEGTCELCGPKVCSNREKFTKCILIPHSSAEIYLDCPRTFIELREWLRNKDIEGIVFHHSDGRKAKIKKRDFGMERV